MSKTLLTKALIPLILLVIIGFFSYTYFLKDYYLNNQTQTVKIDQKSATKVFELVKHEEQKNIYSLEIELSGKTAKPFSLFLSSSPKEMEQEIRIKGGEIDFQFAGDWYSNKCYLLVKFEDEDPGDLSIDYRFIGSQN